MQGHAEDQGLLLGPFFQSEIPLDRRNQERLAPIEFVTRDRGTKGSQVDPNLVHPPRDRPAFHQGVPGEYLESIEFRFRVFAPGSQLDHAVRLLKDPGAHHYILKIMPAVYHRVIYFAHGPMLKLHAQVPVRLGVSGDGQHAGRVFVQPMSNLWVRFSGACQGQQVFFR